jgi:hypothetical protein
MQGGKVGEKLLLQIETDLWVQFKEEGGWEEDK